MTPQMPHILRIVLNVPRRHGTICLNRGETERLVACVCWQGLCAYFIGQWMAKTPLQMVIADNLGWGILSAGGMAVQGAALDDMFGDRPELNSAIGSANASVAGISGCLGPLVGILCWNRCATIHSSIILEHEIQPLMSDDC